jgi:hypothetical protein
MSRRYPPDEKAAILEHLELNHADVLRTSQLTGAPARTLYAWALERQQQHTSILPQQNLPVFPPNIAAKDTELPVFENDLDAMRFMRSRIMQELLTLTMSLNDNLDGTTPFHRVQILSRLLERLMKLDEHLKPYIPAEHVVRIIRTEKPYVNKNFKFTPSQPDPFSDASTEPPEDVEEP